MDESEPFDDKSATGAKFGSTFNSYTVSLHHELTKDLMKNKTSKVILIQFMRGRNLMNVNIAMKYLMKRNTSKVILNKFMRGKNLMNVNIAVKYLIKKNTT